MGFMAGIVNARTHRLVNELRRLADIIEMMRQSETSIYSAKHLNDSLHREWARVNDARQKLEELS